MAHMGERCASGHSRSRSAAFTQTAGQEDGRRGSGDLDQDPLPNPNQPPSQGLPGYKAPLPYDLAVSVSTDQPHRKRKRQSSSQEDECPSTSQQRPAKRSRREAYAKGPLLGRGGFVMDCQLPSNLDIMDHLSLQEGHGRLLLEVALMTLVSSAPACPNVLQLLEWFDHRRRFTMILERPVPCQDLQSFCEENGHLDESLAKKVLLQVISALKHCKSRGVLHRNIKPENLLISTESHDIKLLDFGCGDLLKDSAYKYFAAQWNQCPYWGALDTELHSRVFLGCRNISCAVCRSLSHSTISCPFINPCIPPCPESSQPESTNPMSRALWIPQPLPHFAAAHRPPAARYGPLYLKKTFVGTTEKKTESEDSDYYALAYYSMSSPKRVFGISLEFLRRRGQMRQGVPVVLLQMVEFLDQYGLHQSELFHASRSEARRNELKKSLNRGEFQCFRSSDAHAVASLLILFLRELPYGLIPCWNATRFLRVYTKTKGKVLDLKHAKTVLNSFEPEIFNALCLLIHFLSRVAAQSHVNHMTSKHLSEVFGPCIFQSVLYIYIIKREIFNLERSVLCGLKSEAEEDSTESMDNDSMMRSRGPSPLSDSMVTYGAILKLDEKFEMLQAKVASIQTSHQNPAVHSQRTYLSSSYRESCQGKSESFISSEASMPHLVHISSTSPLPSVESRKPPTLSPGPEVPSPPRLVIQSQSHISVKATVPSHTTQESFSRNKMSLMQHLERAKRPAEVSSEISDAASSADLLKTSCLGSSDRKVFLSNCILQRAGKMARPSAAVRYLSRNIFTAEELSQSSTTGNTKRRLKRLDPNKINAIREWAVKRYPKFDLREKGKDWKMCLSVINSTARYYRFMDKTRKLKVKEKARLENTTESVPTAVTCTAAAEIDVELSDSDTEQKQPEMLISHITEDIDTPTDWESNSVYLGPPHRDVKVPEFALSAAHLRTRPELIARYLIKFIFPEDVLVRSNVYGGVRRGIQALDHNKISALREHLLERFPWMKLEEDGSDWKVCVGAINSTIRKFRYERKMGIKRGIR
ncbi:BEN domain-containing 2-like protein [Labeo rohita]|uniref:BEN domain-containing 2-like protein n=2 Tax=Labeonini TaxID=2743697 RepID=A0A498LJQ9_LABRO|nr:BEN domain-containing 2-like protein [Labeo rohita]